MHDLGVRQHETAIARDEMHVGPCDVHHACLDRLTVDGLSHGELRPPREEIGKQALVARIHVLDDEHRGRKRRGQRGDDDVQRLDAPGRRADRNDVERGRCR